MLYNPPPSSFLSYEVCSTSCDYTLRLKWSGSDIDDNQLYFTGANVGDNEDKYLEEKYLINTANLPELEEKLELLGIGKFEATVVDGWLNISSSQNPLTLNALHFEQEGQEIDLCFNQGNCSEQLPCEGGVRRCEYSLFRQLSAVGCQEEEWKLSVKRIEYSGSTYDAPHLIDVRDTVALSAWIKSHLESEGKVATSFDNINLIFRIIYGSIKARPTKVVFEVQSKDTQTNAIIKTATETSFIQYNCATQCCEPCGEQGQAPCANAQHPCDDGLVVDKNNRCLPPCIKGKRYVNGEWISAGAVGQFPDCNGECADGLIVGEDGACRSSDINNTICTLVYKAEANPNDHFLGITIGGTIGTRRPSNGILFDDGTKVLEWLNTESGICPDSVPCFTMAPVVDVPDTELKRYEFILTNVAITIPDNGIANPIEMTKKWCGDEQAYSCLYAENCHVATANPDCPYASHWDAQYFRCVANSQDMNGTSNRTSNRSTQNRVGHTKPVDPLYNVLPHKANIELLISAEIAEMTKVKNLVESLKIKAESFGAIFDLTREARKRLIAKGILPKHEAFAYVVNGKILNI